MQMFSRIESEDCHFFIKRSKEIIRYAISAPVFLRDHRGSVILTLKQMIPSLWERHGRRILCSAKPTVRPFMGLTV